MTAIIPISYKDDRRKAESIMLQAVRHHTQEIAAMAQPELDRLHRRYFIEAPDLEPRVFLRITGSFSAA